MATTRHPRASVRVHLVCAAFALSTAFALGACIKSLPLNTGGVSTKFNLIVAGNADSTKNHPANAPFEISASCTAGQQMVGGGYSLLNNDNAHPPLVTIEASYPSSVNTWTVQARNPDNPELYQGDADVVVQVMAYCLTTPGYDISTEIVSNQVTLPRTYNVGTDIDVRCSQTGGLALSGGFKTTTLPTYTEPGGGAHEAFWPGLLGTGITHSGPRLPDTSHSAMGWHVTQKYMPALNPTAPQPVVSTTVFGLCARQNLNAQSYRISSSSGVLSPTSALDTPCGTGEFTVSGGYDDIPVAFGNGAVPAVTGYRAIPVQFSFNTWQLQGESVASIKTSTLCVRIPMI